VNRLLNERRGRRWVRDAIRVTFHLRSGLVALAA
jgi:hypothetical protein